MTDGRVMELEAENYRLRQELLAATGGYPKHEAPSTAVGDVRLSPDEMLAKATGRPSGDIPIPGAPPLPNIRDTMQAAAAADVTLIPAPLLVQWLDRVESALANFGQRLEGVETVTSATKDAACHALKEVLKLGDTVNLLPCAPTPTKPPAAACALKVVGDNGAE